MQFVVQLILNAKSEMLIFSFWRNFILPQTSHELHNFARWTAAQGAVFLTAESNPASRKEAGHRLQGTAYPPIAGLNTAFLQHILLMIEPAAPRMGRGGVQFVQLFCEDLLQSCKAGQTVDLLKLHFALDQRHGVLDKIFRHVVALRRDPVPADVVLLSEKEKVSMRKRARAESLRPGLKILP